MLRANGYIRRFAPCLDGGDLHEDRDTSMAKEHGLRVVYFYVDNSFAFVCGASRLALPVKMRIGGASLANRGKEQALIRTTCQTGRFSLLRAEIRYF